MGLMKCSSGEKILDRLALLLELGASLRITIHILFIHSAFLL